jgi:hypothetical protein
MFFPKLFIRSSHSSKLFNHQNLLIKRAWVYLNIILLNIKRKKLRGQLVQQVNIAQLYSPKKEIYLKRTKTQMMIMRMTTRTLMMTLSPTKPQMKKKMLLARPQRFKLKNLRRRNKSLKSNQLSKFLQQLHQTLEILKTLLMSKLKHKVRNQNPNK